MVQAAGPSRSGSGGVPQSTGNGALAASGARIGAVVVGLMVGVGLVCGVWVG